MSPALASTAATASRSVASVPPASFAGTVTARAPTSLAMFAYGPQYGSMITASSPASSSARNAIDSAHSEPLVTTTFAGSTSYACRRDSNAAIRSRSAGSPRGST